MYSTALQVLEHYEAQYPNGVLREEQLAIRALALCAAGRRNEARARAAQLVAFAPCSPYLKQLGSACTP